MQALVGRVQRLLLSPSTEWRVIEGESASMGELYRSYVLPLVVLSAASSALGSLFIGLGFGFALRSFVFSVLFGLAGVYVLALIVDALAPAFGGRKNPDRAFKIAAYAPTAGWLASVFSIIPPLAILSIVGLYSLYLFFVGLPILMKASADKALFYTFAVVGCCIVFALVLSLILMPVLLGVSFL